MPASCERSLNVEPYSPQLSRKNKLFIVNDMRNYQDRNQIQPQQLPYFESELNEDQKEAKRKIGIDIKELTILPNQGMISLALSILF